MSFPAKLQAIHDACAPLLQDLQKTAEKGPDDFQTNSAVDPRYIILYDILRQASELLKIPPEGKTTNLNSRRCPKYTSYEKVLDQWCFLLEENLKAYANADPTPIRPDTPLPDDCYSSPARFRAVIEDILHQVEDDIAQKAVPNPKALQLLRQLEEWDPRRDTVDNALADTEWDALRDINHYLYCYSNESYKTTKNPQIVAELIK